MSTENVTDVHCNVPAGLVTFIATMDKPLSVATEAERWRRFGRFVRTYREDTAKLSQTDAARVAEMTRQQWNRIEKGTSGSKRPTIIKIAEALKADPLIFLNQAGFQENSEAFAPAVANDIEMARLSRYYSELPRECQLDVLALTEALWRRRRAEGRAERSDGKKSGKRATRVVYPSEGRPHRKKKVS